MDIPQRSAGEADRCRDVHQRAVHQDNICGIHCDIRSCADGNAGVGPHQSRRIVDSVADHRCPAAFPELPDHGFLPVGQYAGNDVIHAGGCSDGPGGTLIVAGQHDHMESLPFQLADCLRRVRLDSVRHGDDADQIPVFREEQGSLSLLRKAQGFPVQRFGDPGQPADVGPVSSAEVMTVHLCGQSVSGEGRKVRYLRYFHSAGFPFGYDGPGQRMFTLLLQRAGFPDQLLFRISVRGADVCHLRFAGGDGSGFVQRNDLYPAGVFQRFTGLEQDPVFRAHAVTDHNRHRGCQPQGTGA